MKRPFIASFRAGILALLVLLTALPAVASAQDATPPRDPLGGDARMLGGSQQQATPTAPHDTSSLAPTADVLGILTGTGETTSSTPSSADTIRVLLLGLDGQPLGEVSVTPLAGGLLVIQVSGSSLPPGFHGLHIHETGVCETGGITPFGSAGAHLSRTDADHPGHAGDLPSLLVLESGLAGLAVVTDRLTLDDLLDADGSALIVHENPDNFAHIPQRYGTPDADALATGYGGARIACAAFTP